MKKNVKRVLAVLLVLLTAISSLPLVYAQNGAAQEANADAEVGFAGGNAFDLIAGKLSAEGETDGYSISWLEIENGKAYVDVGNAAPCTLVVAVYEEDTMRMVTSGTAEVPTEHLAVEVELAAALPEYYIVKAFLLDENHCALCKEYTCMLYTRAYAEFLEKTPEDFSGDTVVVFDEGGAEEPADFAVLAEGAVLEVNAEGMTFTYNEATDTFTFLNATEEVKNLAAGDVYYYQYGEASNEFLLFKVKSVTVSCDTVTVTQDADIGLADVFQFVRIDAEGDYSDLSLNEEDLGEALTLLPESQKVRRRDPEFDIDTENSWSTSFKVKWNLYDNGSGGTDDDAFIKASISGTMQYQLSSSVKLIYDVKLFGKDYYEFKSETKHTITLAGFKVEGKLVLPTDVVKIPIPEIPIGPFTLEITVAPVFELSVNIGFNITYVIKNIVTADSASGMQKTEETTSEWDVSLQNKIEIKLGLHIEFKLKFAEIISLALSGEGGLKFTGIPSTVSVWTDEHHDCIVCVYGDVNGFVEIKLTFAIKIIPKVLDFSWDAVKWSKEWYLFDFHISLSRDGFSCGRGGCDRISYAVTFETVQNDPGGMIGQTVPLGGVTVSAPTGLCDADGDKKYDDTSITTDDGGKAVFWFRPGTHTVSFSKDGYRSTVKSVEIIAQKKTVEVYLAGDSSSGTNDPDDPDDPNDPGTQNPDDLKTGDHILYGTYPQSRVTDAALIAKLEAAPKTWKSYNYYSGTGTRADGQMAPSDYMRFADFFVGGAKYRAVTFSEYRPYYTGYTRSSGNSHQDDNGYMPNNVYYFLYEPITWRILDPTDGLILSELLLDSQAYQNTSCYAYTNNTFIYWQNTFCNTYASDYAASSIRSWLNHDFYETAFADAQKANIRNDVALNNDARRGGAEYNSASTKDKLFLLSYAEATNGAYGFASSGYTDDTARQAQGTDYAKAQGLYISESDSYADCSLWWLRSPYNSGGACVVGIDGVIDTGYGDVFSTDYGVRVACRLSNLKSDISQSQTLFSETGGAGAKLSAPQKKNAPAAEALTCERTDVVKGDEYVLIVVKDAEAENLLTPENLLYIDQKTAESETVSFTYTPRENAEAISAEIYGPTAETHVHRYEPHVSRAATCTAPGEMLYTCRCGSSYSEEIPAAGHAWGDWAKMDDTQHQRVCANDPSHTETEAHAWDDGELTKPATAAEAGEKTFTCTVCGAKRTEEVPKLPDEPPAFVPGDVDGDDKVTASDARLALRRAVELEDYAPGTREYLACDVDHDGKVTASDARLILRAAVGLENLT